MYDQLQFLLDAFDQMMNKTNYKKFL